jgi:hypothetical protein
LYQVVLVLGLVEQGLRVLKVIQVPKVLKVKQDLKVPQVKLVLLARMHYGISVENGTQIKITIL